MKPLIYHNPDYGTSRNTLAMIKASSEAPNAIEYLKAPSSRDRLISLLTMMKIAPRAPILGWFPKKWGARSAPHSRQSSGLMQVSGGSQSFNSVNQRAI